MAKLGTVVKSKKQQAEAAELETIIEEMAHAMRNANRVYIGRDPECSHDSCIRFTLAMESAWDRYYYFCKTHPHE